MTASPIRRWSVRALALSAGAATALLGQAVLRAPDGDPRAAIHADFAYDTSDPRLVAGDATVVAVATVERAVRVDGDRTVFGVRARALLEGATPERYNVSQLGYRTRDHAYEVEGFPLMRPGRTYVMAMVAPAPNEPPDALLLLTASAGGNLIEVEGAGDAAVDRYRDAVAGQRSPWAPADRVDEQRADDYRRWRLGTRD